MLKLLHDAAADAVDDPQTLTVDFDELCWVAAQQMLATALLAERRDTSTRTPMSSTRPVSGWSSATATRSLGR